MCVCEGILHPLKCTLIRANTAGEEAAEKWRDQKLQSFFRFLLLLFLLSVGIKNDSEGEYHRGGGTRKISTPDT